MFPDVRGSEAVATNPDLNPAEDGASLAHALERVTEELDLISYTASHDLQAPIRFILMSCEKLATSPAIAADKEAQGATQSITREATRLKTLLQGVLDYLRLQTHEPTRSPVDMNQAYATALSLFEQKIRDSGAKVTCEKLPEVWGHRGRLTRLLSLLIDNALTFCNAAPQVHISSQVKNGWAEISVSDNGVGIAEEYYDIVFRLFQKLHAQGEYPGEGIGLALARKIVESHGGTMHVESQEGKGSRFFFTLPLQPQGRMT